MGVEHRWRPGRALPHDSRHLPDDQACFRLANAHGARDPARNSITQRLDVGTFNMGDQIEAAGHRVNLCDHRVVQLKVPTSSRWVIELRAGSRAPWAFAKR